MTINSEIVGKTDLQKGWRKSLCRISQETQEESLQKDENLEKKEFENNTKVRDFLEKLLENYSNPKILDVGSGLFWKTYIPEKYWGRTSRVDWVDSKDQNNFKKADIEEGLPFEDESFDVVLSKQLFSHLDNWGKSMDEMQRVLKKEGSLVTIEFEGDLTDGKTRIAVFDPEKVEEQMGGNGFKNIQKEILDNLNTGLKNNLTAVVGEK